VQISSFCSGDLESNHSMTRFKKSRWLRRTLSDGVAVVLEEEKESLPLLVGLIVVLEEDDFVSLLALD